MNIKLTEKELELLSSALIFTSTTDACIDVTAKDRKLLIDIAKRFGAKNITSAYIYQGNFDEFEEPTITKSILKNFNIRKE